MTQAKDHRVAGGFTLLEVLLALLLGLVVVGLVAQSLLMESGHARRLGQLLRERLVAQRTLALIADEVQQAQQITRSAPTGDTKGCGLSGRQVRLHLALHAGAITYSVEKDPNVIWRGAVLMRCGPVYGLDGAMHAGTRESSVLVDAVVGNTLLVHPMGDGILLQLDRSFGDGRGTTDQLREEMLVVGSTAVVQ